MMNLHMRCQITIITVFQYVILVTAIVIEDWRSAEVFEKDSIVLSCDLSNLGSHPPVWMKGKLPIFSIFTLFNLFGFGPFSLVEGHKLKINSAGIDTADNYTCQIGSRQIKYSLEVLEPPYIIETLPKGERSVFMPVIKVKPGASVIIECRAVGNPRPTITWTKKNQTLSTDKECPYEENLENNVREKYQEKSKKYWNRSSKIARKCLTFDNVSKLELGVYVCKAFNGIEVEDQKSVILHMESDESNINKTVQEDSGTREQRIVTVGKKIWASSLNDTVVLPCKIINLGKGQHVSWKKEENVLSLDIINFSAFDETIYGLFNTRDGIVHNKQGMVDEYNLRIENLEKHDAGNYTCQIGPEPYQEIIHLLVIKL